jgi:hypothetical protein
MGKIIYLASPYSNPDDDKRHESFENVSRIAADLCAEGHVAFSPITYGHTLVNFRGAMPTDWPFWQNFCLSFLEVSDELHVCKMEGWNRSRGVAEEIEFAVKNGIEIKYIDC